MERNDAIMRILEEELSIGRTDIIFSMIDMAEKNTLDTFLKTRMDSRVALKEEEIVKLEKQITDIRAEVATASSVKPK